MITDNVEALLAAHNRPELHAVSPEQPFTSDQFGYMVPIDAAPLLGWLNLWIGRMKERGELAKFNEKWIGNLGQSSRTGPNRDL